MAGNEYIIEVPASGDMTRINMKTKTSLNSGTYVTYTFSYYGTGVLQEDWITGVWAYGLVTGVSGTVDPNGVSTYNAQKSLRAAGTPVVMYERYGNPIQLWATCSKNTGGARSFRGRLNNYGDYLTIKQAAYEGEEDGDNTLETIPLKFSAEGEERFLKTDYANISFSDWVLDGSSWVHLVLYGSPINGYYVRIDENTNFTNRTASMWLYRNGNVLKTYNISQSGATTGSVPSMPTVKIATRENYANPNTITVTWTGGTGATSFNLYRAWTNGLPSAAYKTGVTSPYIDTNATPGMKYYYWVEAKNAAGSTFSESDWGNRAIVLEASPASLVSARTGETHQVSVTGSDISWMAETDVYWIHFYWGSEGSGNGTIQFETGENFGENSRTGTVTITAGGRSAALGFGFSKSVTITVTQEGGTIAVPIPPMSVSATTTRTDGIQLTWSGGSGATSYNVWRGTTTNLANASKIKTGASSPYTDASSALVAGTRYYYWIEAVGSGGSAYSGCDWGIKVAPTPTLTSLTIGGASDVAAGAGTQYACTANWSDGNQTTVTTSATWSIDAGSTYGDIGSTGYFTAYSTSTGGDVVLRAAYGGKSATKAVHVAAAVQTVPLPTALDNSSLNFTTGGDASWFGQTSTAHDGVDSARSGLIGHSESTWLETTVSGPGILSFWWKVSSEASWDVLKVAVDGTVDSSISGSDGGWERKSLSIASGAHTVRWTYSKDGSVTNGSDCAWVDQVSFTADTSSRVGTPAVSASGTQTGVELVWGEVTNATGFAVWRAESASGTRTQLSSRVTTNTVGMYTTVDGQFTYVESRSYSATDATGTPGQDYWYWVVASNATSSATSSAATAWRRVALSVSPGTLVVPSGGGTGMVAVTANTAWRASGGNGWISFATASGNGNGTCTFRVDANTETADRVAAVIIEAGAGTAHPATETVTVTQEGFRFAIGGFAMDMENGLVWLRFSGTKGTAYRVERVRNFGGTWATALSFTATNDGVNEVNASIPGKWDTGFFRLATDATNATVSPEVPANTATGLYLVVDLSGGPDAANYPVSCLDTEPQGGWPDEYKTAKLVLRRINPGTYTMGCETTEVGYTGTEAVPHEVTITQPFYIGVFEVTQKQWELVMGTKPSYFSNASCYEKRPVEEVSWNMIRGTSSTCNWPTTSEVDATSFLGKLRAKAVGGPGLSWDLPTEAQWEYACRAGTTKALNSGKDLTGTSECANMAEVGRYYYNKSDGKGGYSEHTTVGSYLPNAWGLYDMHGNVSEWCLDWYGNYAAETEPEPAGPDFGSYRVRRGACLGDNAHCCRSARRDNSAPANAFYTLGFRLACPTGP